MAKTIDKNKLNQSKQLQKQSEREKGQGNQLLGAKSKIKREMSKDLARVKSIQQSQKDADKAFADKQKNHKHRGIKNLEEQVYLIVKRQAEDRLTCTQARRLKQKLKIKYLFSNLIGILTMIKGNLLKMPKDK